MRLWALVMLVGFAGSTSYANPQVVDIQVDATVIRPIDGQGMNWDGPGGEKPTPATKYMKDQAAKLIAQRVIPAGVGVALGPIAVAMALDFADKQFAPPDPFGEIVVDGRVVGALDVLQDEFAPVWRTPARFVELHPSSVVTVTLIDEDLSGAHDLIGTCRFKVPALKDTTPVTLTSKACSEDLLAASVVVRLASAPAPIIPGRYRIGVARAGLPATDRDGTEWDVSSRPDPRLEVTVGTRRFVCSRNEGQRAGICDPALTFDVDAKTSIGLRVVEVDALVDDPVGSAVLDKLLSRESHRPMAMTVNGLEWAEVVLLPASR